jgi:microcystin-dependent protein
MATGIALPDTSNITTANTNISNLQTATTGITYTAASGVLSSYTTITNDFLKATSIEFTTNINNVSATIFERLRNITSDVQQQFTTLTNSISASTVPIATIISNLNPNLQTQSSNQYLLCNGQAVSRTTFANLFAVIGLNFGFPTGDYDSFYVPNYSGLFLRAQGNQTINGVFYTSSSNYYTFQSDGMQDHTHGGPGGTYLITQYQQPENSLAQGYSKSATNLNRPNSQSIGSSNYINSAGARTSTDTRPGNYSAYYYIKT